MLMNISLEFFKKDLILDIQESQNFKISFNHGDNYYFRIGQKGLDFGDLRAPRI